MLDLLDGAMLAIGMRRFSITEAVCYLEPFLIGRPFDVKNLVE